MATKAKRSKSTKAKSTSAASKSSQSGSAQSKSAASKSTKSKAAGAKRSAGTKKKAAKKTSAKRTLIAPKGDKRYVRRTTKGRFKESDDVGKSLSTDRRKHAKSKASPGQGDKGD